MRWLLYLVMAIVGLLVLIALIGLLLPRAHRATRMVRLKQSPEVVFATITAMDQTWRGAGIVRHEVASTGSPPRRRWSEPWGRRAIVFEEIALDPPRRYQTRIVGDESGRSLPFGGTWIYDISPAPGTDGGCTCRITEEGDVGNPIFRFVSRFVIGHTRTIDTYLKALCGKFGEPVKIEP